MLNQTNEIWNLGDGFHALYTEDPAVMKRIQRSYPDFEVMATYYAKNGKVKAIQYKLPSSRKRSAIRLGGVKVS